jgi:hypothetical protein
VRRGSRSAYIGLGGEGRRHPSGHGHQWPAALMMIQEGGVKSENCRLTAGKGRRGAGKPAVTAGGHEGGAVDPRLEVGGDPDLRAPPVIDRCKKKRRGGS